MILLTHKLGASTLRVLDFNVRRAFDDGDTGDVAYHADEGNRDGDENTSLRKTTLNVSTTPRTFTCPTSLWTTSRAGCPIAKRAGTSVAIIRG